MDLQFVLVGDKQDTLEIPTQYRDHVTLQGKISPEVIPNYYHKSDLLVHPSLTEGIPRVVLEALASGTRVIARNAGDISSVTGNTFNTDDEFVSMVSRFESLQLDDVGSFSRDALKPKYRSFFMSF